MYGADQAARKAAVNNVGLVVRFTPYVFAPKKSAELRFCRRGPLLTGPHNLHTGVKKLRNLSISSPAGTAEKEPLRLSEQNNAFLIDWLTVVFHGQTVHGIKVLLGLDGADIPWQERQAFVYGYPRTTYWNNICIRWGADDENNYKDDDNKTAAEKVRTDMGICLEMSGTGCRAFEQYGKGDWLQLFNDINSTFGRWTVTRLDLAFDDHSGLLDIAQIERDTRDRNYISKSRKSRVTWSDDLDEDIQGMTIEIGSRQSDVLIRIYDKAAERGYDHSKHWIRVETQLRKDRALAGVMMLMEEQHVGKLTSGILRNYLTFRTPSDDSNKSRWPVAPYWEKLLVNMDKIRIVLTPGEPYNYSKTEAHMKMQYGQAFVAYFRMHGEVQTFLRDCLQMFPNLAPKYEAAIAEFKFIAEERQERLRKVRKYYGFQLLPDDDPAYQLDFAELFGDELLKKEAPNEPVPYQTPYQIPACSPALGDEKTADSAADGGESV